MSTPKYIKYRGATYRIALEWGTPQPSTLPEWSAKGKTAKFIRKLPSAHRDARLYLLSQPVPVPDDDTGVEVTNYVVASSIDNKDGQETLVFATDESGETLGVGYALASSGPGQHKDALEQLGFVVLE